MSNYGDGTKRAGRKCGSCYWFTRNQSSTWNGHCGIRFPYGGFRGQLESHESGKHPEHDWCSFWVPNMGAIE